MTSSLHQQIAGHYYKSLCSHNDMQLCVLSTENIIIGLDCAIYTGYCHTLLLKTAVNTSKDYFDTKSYTPTWFLVLWSWFFSKYAKCIENVQWTPRIGPRLREVLWMHDCMHDHHIHWSIFHCVKMVKLLIFFMFSGILKPFYLFFFTVMYELGQ